VLALLMFQLGLTLTLKDFWRVIERPRAVVAGLFGQLLLLPAIAYVLGWAWGLEPVFFLGLMLIACSPGGSSSNVFSMLARGDVALSVSLTACSSVLTLFTIPVVMSLTAQAVPGTTAADIHLPVGQLIGQNLVLALLPVFIGMGVRHWWSATASKLSKVLEKVALPLLVLLVVVFYSQNSDQLLAHLPTLGLLIGLLILLAMGGGWFFSRCASLDKKEQRTLIIEVGMQNAAQAIAMAASPFVYNNETMAIPAIVYSLMMNILLITYVLLVKGKKTE
jgi:BASS family bile acid:Na+ symporter